MTIHKDFYAKRSEGLASDAIDEEFMTYPNAIVCFEDTKFKSFLTREENEGNLEIELTHVKNVFGYAVRLKYTRLS